MSEVLHAVIPAPDRLNTTGEQKNFCRYCKHCESYQRAWNEWECDAPQNIVSKEINLVNDTWIVNRIARSCGECRTNESACGKEGRWYEKRNLPTVKQLIDTELLAKEVSFDAAALQATRAAADEAIRKRREAKFKPVGLSEADLKSL